MNTHRSFTLSSLALAALALGSVALAQRERHDLPAYPLWEDPTQPGEHGHILRFGGHAEAFGLQHMAGRPVRSRTGEELSTITDFLVDPQIGHVYFALLPSGGGAHGMTYRIVPIGAFTGSDESALMLRLDRGQWDRVGTIEETMLQDHVVIDVDHQQRLSRQLGFPMAEINDAHGPLDLIRASSLRGQLIRAGSGQLGRIEDVVVDVPRHESAVIVAVEREFAGPLGVEQRYVIPYRELGKREGRTWISQLRREDFPRPDRVSRDDRIDRDRREDRLEGNRLLDRPAEDNRAGLPTGRDREPFMNLGPTASAVKQTLDRSWAGGRVDVIPEGNHLVLRGTVDDENERAEVERLASRTAADVRIENQIAIRHR